MTESSSAPTKIQFIEYHQPSLQTGKYEIQVTQTIDSSKVANQNPFTTGPKTFYVAGERFTLNPQDIHAVFPPAGSLGDHSNVLPHIILNRSTLPWERTIDDSSGNITWLALLLFDEDEKPEPKILTLKQLKNIDSNPSIKFPTFDLEPGQDNDDKITIIDVKRSLIEKILPTLQDLNYLAHVRQGTNDDNNLVGNEFSVIICNRLPKPKGTSVVHLVSLERRYKDKVFDFQDAGENDYIRLISLKSWSFACIEEKHTFKKLLKNLNQSPSTLRLPGSSHTENYLKMGYVPLPHYLRQGGKTISWYRSPLATGENSTDIELAISSAGNSTDIKLAIGSADQLVRYNPDNGMFDVSYAAAWELGRLLALQNKGFSISLYRWKRSLIQQVKQQEIRNSGQLRPFDHLPVKIQQVPVKTKPESSLHIPNDIFSWLSDLSLLNGVPFSYLVPDERLLPVESIRFFWIDRLWIECLLDGAFSIGRITEFDRKNELQRFTELASNFPKIITGFLLRSDVVSGWPGLQVDGKGTVNSQNSQKLKLLRMERLSTNVLICLFEGEIQEVDIHQSPETIHFGFDCSEEKLLFKKLRNCQGELKKDGKKIESIPRNNNDSTQRTIKIQELADSMKIALEFPVNFTSAHFALQAIEGVEMVRFTKKN